MVDLQYSFVLSTPSSTTVTTLAVTARLSPCLSGRHTLSADMYVSLNGVISDCQSSLNLTVTSKYIKYDSVASIQYDLLI